MREHAGSARDAPRQRESRAATLILERGGSAELHSTVAARVRTHSDTEALMDEMTSTLLDYVRGEYIDDDDDLDVRPETPLITSGIVDSFSMVSLKTFVEKKYGVAIPDSEATPAAFDTVRSIVALVKKHQGP
jgi:acyl carrier protein